MERVNFKDHNCSVARSVDIVGDWWNLLIIRELLWGTTKFDDFQQNLAISKGILSKRLKLLQEHGIVIKHSTGSSTNYFLTGKGRALNVVIIAMMQWGDEWNPLPRGAPVIPINRKTSATLAPIQLMDIGGKAIALEDLSLRPGPGADDSTLERLDRAREAYKKNTAISHS